MESAARSHRDSPRAGALSAEAAVTIGLVVLASFALDDITTDNSTGFRPEYTVMLVTWLWFLAFAIVLVVLGRRVMPTGAK